MQYLVSPKDHHSASFIVKSSRGQVAVSVTGAYKQATINLHDQVIMTAGAATFRSMETGAAFSLSANGDAGARNIVITSEVTKLPVARRIESPHNLRVFTLAGSSSNPIDHRNDR